LASLQLVKELKLDVSIVLTNDWFGGLASAFRKQGFFGDYFNVY